MTREELVETFSYLEDWEERYRLIIDLGAELPDLENKYKIEMNRVIGCQSNVWLIPHVDDQSTPPTMDFTADSDSQIVKGLIAVLKILFAEKTAAEIASTDYEAFFKELGLDQHLSPGRSNGLRAMTQKILDIAGAASSSKN